MRYDPSSDVTVASTFFGHDVSGGINITDDNAGINITDVNNSYDDYIYNYEDSLTTVQLKEVIPVACVYGLMLFIGMVGNTLVIFSIVRYRRMRNVTNAFLLSLSSADLLVVLICIPVKFAAFFSFTWTFGEFLCKGVHYLQNVSAICSVFTLTAMSLERYYAILHPMRAKYVCTVGNARRTILVVWIMSVLLAIPIVFQRIHKLVGFVRTGYWCVKNWDQTLYSQLYELYMLSIILVFPVIIMSFAYASICFELWVMTNRRSAMRGGMTMSSPSGRTPDNSPYRVTSERTPVVKRKTLKFSSDDDSTRKQVIKMLVAVITIFIICWAPITLNNVLTAFGIIDSLNYGYLKPMRQAFYLLAYVNSCVNPIVYGFMSKNFRQTFAYALCTCIKGREYSRRKYLMRHNSLVTRTSNVSTYRYDDVDILKSHSTSSSGGPFRPVSPRMSKHVDGVELVCVDSLYGTNGANYV